MNTAHIFIEQCSLDGLANRRGASPITIKLFDSIQRGDFIVLPLRLESSRVRCKNTMVCGL